MKTPLALLLSDIHLSKNIPVARSAESDWLKVIRRQWKLINETAKKYNVPIVIAGDIFDKWNSSPEIINLAIELFANHKIYAVPGQHDLPNHKYDQLHRSAYGVLVNANIITDLTPETSFPISKELTLYGFPWGHTPHPNHPIRKTIHLAVVHQYLWTPETGYLGAPKEVKLTTNTTKMFEGYDAVVVGDNHQHFHYKHIFNCGGFIPRRSDEHQAHTPCFGILWSTREITKHLLPTEEDKWISTIDKKETSLSLKEQKDLTSFVKMLENLGGEKLEFESTIQLYLEKNQIDNRVKELVLEVLSEDGST